MMSRHRDAIRTARSVVVKIGTTALTTPTGEFDVNRLQYLGDAIEARMKAGSDVVIVSSGAIAAGIEPLQIVGVIVGLPIVARMSERSPGFLLRFIAIVGVFDGFVLVVLAYSPSVWLAIAMHSILATTIGTLAPAFGAMLSLISPPRCRSAAFPTISVFAIPGIAIFLPLIGSISDAIGIQASMLTLVPVSLAAGFLLSSGAKFIEEDIEAVRLESPLERVAAGPPDIIG